MRCRGGQSSLDPAVKIIDSTSRVWQMETNGAMPVNIQDQHSSVLDFYFRQILNTCTLAADAVYDTNALTLVAGHGFVVGETIVFKEGTHFMQAVVLTVVVNALTIDSPFDYAFTTAAVVQRCNKNLAVDGSVTPVIFKITAADVTLDLDVTRIIFHIEDNVIMDTSTFGGLTALTKGVVIRAKNGITKNLFNVKSNGDFTHHCDSIKYDDKAPAGMYGFSAIRKFAGQSETGVTIRLESATSDELQVIVQDNLTALTEFHVIAQGHVVQN